MRRRNLSWRRLTTHNDEGWKQTVSSPRPRSSVEPNPQVGRSVERNLQVREIFLNFIICGIFIFLELCHLHVLWHSIVIRETLAHRLFSCCWGNDSLRPTVPAPPSKTHNCLPISCQLWHIVADVFPFPESHWSVVTSLALPLKGFSDSCGLQCVSYSWCCLTKSFCTAFSAKRISTSWYSYSAPEKGFIQFYMQMSTNAGGQSLCPSLAKPDERAYPENRSRSMFIEAGISCSLCRNHVGISIIYRNTILETQQLQARISFFLGGFPPKPP